MNLIERTFKEYLEVFHSTLSETAEEYLPSGIPNKLLHLSFLPAQIIGYVSTKFGVGFEYVSAKETNIKIVIGAVRIENLLLRIPKFPENMGKVVVINNTNCFFERITFDEIIPFELTGDNSSVFVKDSYFKIGSIKKTVTYAELHSNRNIENWSREKAVTRAKDEVLAALVKVLPIVKTTFRSN